MKKYNSHQGGNKIPSRQQLSAQNAELSARAETILNAVPAKIVDSGETGHWLVLRDDTEYPRFEVGRVRKIMDKTTLTERFVTDTFTATSADVEVIRRSPYLEVPESRLRTFSTYELGVAGGSDDEIAQSAPSFGPANYQKAVGRIRDRFSRAVIEDRLGDFEGSIEYREAAIANPDLNPATAELAYLAGFVVPISDRIAA